MKLIQNIRNKISRVMGYESYLQRLDARLTQVLESLGRLENRQLADRPSGELSSYEFKVYSQRGEDGIIQYLLRQVKVPNKTFVEFGVECYTESNTRFLLTNDYWNGLVLDSSMDAIRYIRNDPIYWQYNLKAVQAFITRENINALLLDNGISGDIGLLSIDVDGNDYWIWKAIEGVRPALVVIEYNHRFGKDKAVTIPYRSDFERSKAHPSMVYYGASLRALCLLGRQKGYSFVGCNRTGSNAFFVRCDLKPTHLPELKPAQGHVAGQFRESRDKEGHLVFLSPSEEAKILQMLPVIDVEEKG